MDAGYVRAVLTMFVQLYNKGYIYRDNRLINWCPTCASTISDLEVEVPDRAGARCARCAIRLSDATSR